MTSKRFQFGMRGLLILVLAVACFFGGWTARDRLAQIRGEELRLMYQPTIDGEVFELGSQIENLREQNKVLEEMVEQLNAEIEELNAVVDGSLDD